MEYNVQFGYEVGDEILVKPIGLPGIVVALLWDRDGRQYKVAFWSEGDRKEAWLFPQEVGPKKKGGQ